MPLMLKKGLPRRRKQQIDLLERIAFEDIIPKGHVMVELKNERGKVVDREEKDNFISIVWKAYARNLLRMPFLWGSYNPSFDGGYTGKMTGNPNGTPNSITWPYGHKGTMPILPFQAVGCWNDTSAEAATTEHKIYMPGNATGMVAWASKWPFASATGARGNIDQAGSSLTETAVTWKWNWSTSQGVGTFRSVGLFNPGAPGIPQMYGGMSHRGKLYCAAITSSQIHAGGTTVCPGGGYYDASTKKWYFTVSNNLGSSTFRIVSVDATAFLDDASANVLGVAPTVTAAAITNETAEFTPINQYASQNNMHMMHGIDGSGNRIFTYYNQSTGQQYMCKVPSTGTTSTAAVSPANGATTMSAGCVIGTQLFISNRAGANANIYSVTISTFATAATLTIDSNVTALCTLAGLSSPRVASLTTDGTDLYVLYVGTGNSNALCVRLNTSGVLQEIIGMVPTYKGTVQTEASGSPYTQTVYYNSAFFDQFYLRTLEPYASALLDGNFAGSTAYADATSWGTGGVGGNAGQLVWADGALYMVGCITNGALGVNSVTTNVSVPAYGCMRLGWNLGTRVLLSSSKTKSGSQTMDITYGFTLPGLF